MKLKFANSLLVAGLLVSAAGCFTSCKDTDEDVQNQVQDQINTLAQKYDADLATLEAALQSLKELVNKNEQETGVALEVIKATIADVQAAVDAANEKIGSLAERFALIEAAVSELKALSTVVDELKDKYNDLAGKYGDLSDEVDDLGNNYKDLANKYDDLSNQLKDALPKLGEIDDLAQQALKDAEYAKTLAEEAKALAGTASAEAAAEALTQAKLFVKEEIAALESKLSSQIQAVQNRLGIVEGQVNGMNERLIAMNTNIGDLAESVSNLEQQVNTNTQAIEKLRKDCYEMINSLINDILNLEMNINSIIIQEVSSPILGSISAPIDVRTSILFNYYGKPDVDAKIPNFRPMGNNYGNNTPAEDYNGLISYTQEHYLNCNSSASVNAGEIYLDDNGQFGKIYFTANPTNIDLTHGYTFALTNSQGEPVNITLTNVKPSDHVINFGISRTDVSLWEADATVAATDVTSLTVDIESGLKSALKDLVKDRNLSSVADMVKMVYRTLSNNTSMPALGMQIGWNDADDVARTAYSEFNIAATTFCPLSFSTLAGQSLSDRLPEIPDYDAWVNKSIDRINAYFDETLPNKLNIEITLDGVELEEFPTLKLTLTFKADEIEAYFLSDPNDPNSRVDVNVDSIKELVVELEDAFEQVNGYTDNVKDSFEEYIDSVIESMNKQVNSSIGEVLDNLQQEVTGKFESITNRIHRFYSLFEKVYNRVNKFMDDPNHYMQVWMLYSVPNGTELGRVSTSSAVPTVFTGSGNAVNLVATTYNADVLTPSYKKYVAVTNVYFENDHSKGVESGDQDCINAMKEANKQTHMNEVFNGENQLLPFKFVRGKNFTYEIFYQALDFRGNTSTQKFYINVK